MGELLVVADWHNQRAFKVRNYKHIDEEPSEIIVDALAVLMGNYHIERKIAAALILKSLVRERFLEFIMESIAVFPHDRNEIRVRRWTKLIVSKGVCELCGGVENLEAHHIIRWADYPIGRIDPQNGMCLCHSCHTEEHRTDQSYHMMKAKHSKKPLRKGVYIC